MKHEIEAKFDEEHDQIRWWIKGVSRTGKSFDLTVLESRVAEYAMVMAEHASRCKSIDGKVHWFDAAKATALCNTNSSNLRQKIDQMEKMFL